MNDVAPDAAAARRAFERAARNPAECFPVREAARRMDPRLDYVRLEPSRILDAGCGFGVDLALLRRRYPKAELLAVDSAWGQLRAARGRRTFSERARALLSRGAPRLICADMLRLPLADACVGLVWSNITLPWVADPVAAFREFARVLQPGGLLSFSTYGPDTLKELRTALSSAFSSPDSRPRAQRLPDMHDLGDMLLESGLAAPVMDMELVTLTYSSVDTLLEELRGSGQMNVAQGRARGMTGRRAWARFREACESARAEGRIPVTVEMVFGHAWKPERARSERVAPIRFHR